MSYRAGTMKLRIPGNSLPRRQRLAVGRAWAKSDAVGSDSVAGALRLLIEKDYACPKDADDHARVG